MYCVLYAFVALFIQYSVCGSEYVHNVYCMHVLAGSSALYSARNLVAGGLARCTLALGFEKMQKGSLQLDDPADVNPLGEAVDQFICCNPHLQEQVYLLSVL